MDPKEKDALARLLAATPVTAVRHFESLLVHDKFSSFDAFMDHYRKNVKHSQCQENWRVPHFVVHCEDCAREATACICVKCFVNSNHEGHRIVILNSQAGTCDCGNTSLWNPEGFCTSHSMHAMERTTLPEFHEVFEEIVGMIFSYAAQKPEDKEHHDKNVFFLMTWVRQFLELGNVFGDMITTGMIEHGDLQKLFVSMADLGSDTGKVLLDIWGALCNNPRFMSAWALAFFHAEKEFRDLYFERIEKHETLGGLSSLLEFGLLLFYNASPMCHVLDHGFDMASWLVDYLHTCFAKGMFGSTERDIFWAPYVGAYSRADEDCEFRKCPLTVICSTTSG